ncbi:hypothetical protein ACA086_14740 [Muriicola sp. E247]|uniref:hypothetical protein n=1 Tax=Muriicola sp. E247 TaxID=3242730 RepID=UPI0035267BF2
MAGPPLGDAGAKRVNPILSNFHVAAEACFSKAKGNKKATKRSLVRVFMLASDILLGINAVNPRS